jgi:hypothetical protein
VHATVTEGTKTPDVLPNPRSVHVAAGTYRIHVHLYAVKHTSAGATGWFSTFGAAGAPSGTEGTSESNFV